MALIDTLIEFAVILGVIDLVLFLAVLFLALAVGTIYYLVEICRKGR